MIKSIRFILILLCAIIPANVSFAQQSGEARQNSETSGQGQSWIRAWLDQERVALGSEARLLVEVIGPNAADCELSAYPVSDSYEVRGIDGPEFTMRPAVVLGLEENELVATFEMALVPLEKGFLALPPVRIVVAGGRQFMGPALSLKVTDPDRVDEDFVLSVQVEKNPVFLHERIVFRMTLQMSPERFSKIERAESEELFLSWLDSEPAFTSLRIENDKPARSTRSFPVMDGRSAIDFSFERALMDEKEICVFYTIASYLPTKTGTYSFGPCAYTVRFRDSIIWSCKSETIEIEVLPLPEIGRPDSATNGVGRFKVSMEAAPLTLRVGDPLELRFSVEGEGNLELLDMPGFPALRSDFQVQGIDDGGDASRRWRVFHLAPLNARVRAIPELRFSWFDPDSRKYETHSWGPQAIVLLPGKEIDPGAGKPNDIGQESKPTLDASNPWSGVMTLQSISLVGFALLASILVYRVVAANRRRAKADREEKAKDMQAMIAFERGMDSKDPIPPDTLVRLLGDYLQDRFGLSQPDALAGSLSELLVKQGIPVDLARSVEEFLRDLDACRFAEDGETMEGADRWTIQARELVQSLEDAVNS